MERRISPRSSVSLTVYLYMPGGKYRHRCKARNLSSRGLFIETELQNIPDNRPLMMFITTQKTNDSVIRLHRMLARVVRHTSGGVAMMFWRNDQWQVLADDNKRDNQTSEEQYQVANSTRSKKIDLSSED